MGIESRDYLRGESGPRPFGGGSGTDVVTKLIIANVVVFVLQLVTARSGIVEYWLSLGPGDVTSRFQIWRLVTYAFCHDPRSILHILFNMYLLYVTGRRIQSVYGPQEFLLFYLAAAVFSGLSFVLLELLLGQVGVVIGASGAVSAIFLVYAMRHPNEVWRLFGLIPVQVKWLCGLFIVFNLQPVLLQLGGANPASGVAHSAHLGGVLFGFLYEHNHWQLSGLIGRLGRPRFRLPRRRSHLKVYKPEIETGNLESRVDELLKKVHEQGESSLTDKERAILSEASRRYRNRL